MTQTQKPKTWAETSEGEKSAIRAQAYPDIIDDQGREWKLGKIDDLQALNAELLAALKDLADGYNQLAENSFRHGGTWHSKATPEHPYNVARAAIAKAEGR